jgi:hypothetical protein
MVSLVAPNAALRPGYLAALAPPLASLPFKAA